MLENLKENIARKKATKEKLNEMVIEEYKKIEDEQLRKIAQERAKELFDKYRKSKQKKEPDTPAEKAAKKAEKQEKIDQVNNMLESLSGGKKEEEENNGKKDIFKDLI